MTSLELFLQKNHKDRIVMVYGDFNILHPGHIRFLKFAAEQGERLIVGLNDIDFSVSVAVSNEERLEALECISFIECVFILKDDLLSRIRQIIPSVLVKGAEWQSQYNSEEKLINSMGGKLIFGSGETSPIVYNISTLNEFKVTDDIQTKITSFINRHGLIESEILSSITKFSSLKIAVFGDLILDEYVTCEAIGMSREDPTVVVRPLESDVFVGGAGIVAAHAAGLKAKVDFYTVVGTDSLATHAQKELENYGVNTLFFNDESRPTTSKRRYRAQNKTMLRVNDYRQHDIAFSIEEQIILKFTEKCEHYDLIVFSDFNYGLLTASLIEKLMLVAKVNDVTVVADSQSSSQVGDLAKFKNMTFVTPTEHEARVTTQETNKGLVELSAGLGDLLRCEHLMVTLGEDGVLIRSKSDNNWLTDDLPALSSNPLDVSGAGDAMMISAALSMSINNNIWEASLIGSIASSYQVERIGNLPISCHEITNRLELMFK